MLPICISIIILSISVIVLSIVCLRLNKRINTSVKYVDKEGFKIRISHLANSVSFLLDAKCKLDKRITTLEEGNFKDNIYKLQADYDKLVDYLVIKQGVSCKDCIHRDVCNSKKHV